MKPFAAIMRKSKVASFVWDFDITIPIEGEIDEVIIKTKMNERSVWKEDVGFICLFF